MTDHPGERPAIEPPRRRFTVRRGQHGGVQDIEASDRAFKTKAAVWAGAIGVVGVFVSVMLGVLFKIQPPFSYLLPLGGPLAGFLMYKMVMGVSFGSGAVVGNIHNPSGRSTPAVREYSKAQALAIQGHYTEAIDVYEDAVTIYPDDPEPYIRIARMYRDRLHEFERAAMWFRRVRTESVIDPGREMLVTQEIIEIYRLRLGQPKRAIPELARLVDKFPNHPSADAARRELIDLRQMVAEDGQ